MPSLTTGDNSIVAVWGVSGGGSAWRACAVTRRHIATQRARPTACIAAVTMTVSTMPPLIQRGWTTSAAVNLASYQEQKSTSSRRWSCFKTSRHSGVLRKGSTETDLQRGENDEKQRGLGGFDDLCANRQQEHELRFQHEQQACQY